MVGGCYKKWGYGNAYSVPASSSGFGMPSNVGRSCSNLLSVNLKLLFLTFQLWKSPKLVRVIRGALRIINGPGFPSILNPRPHWIDFLSFHESATGSRRFFDQDKYARGFPGIPVCPESASSSRIKPWILVFLSNEVFTPHKNSQSTILSRIIILIETQ
jgi:hypothetical protein